MKMALTRGEARKRITRRGQSHITPISEAPDLLSQRSSWANMLPELLSDIIQRVDASETSWPSRRSVVACASVCRSWREVTKKVVQTPEQCSLLTFPTSLKQPGPRNDPIQCFIRRDKENSTFKLYLGLGPALSGDSSKLLLVAKKIRRATRMEYRISMVTDDFSCRSHAHFGKLWSNFLRTKFRIFETESPCDSQADQRNCMWLKQIIPKQLIPINIPEKVASLSYGVNVIRTRGPRRMSCTIHKIPAHSIPNCWDSEVSSEAISDGKKPTTHHTNHPLVLKNKTPRWNEHLQCWCLNFKGRVTVASVKNFQLVPEVESHPESSATVKDNVILQFGKLGRDIFSMDYRFPLSAFQAFAICLSSFDSKPVCE